jgi:hypothetical protein
VGVIRGSLPAWASQAINGDGSGYGYGYGYGCGYGDGSGYGSGCGYGSGSGSGSGDGSGYWFTLYESSKAKWSEVQQAHLRKCETEASVLAFWKSHKDGTPSNGGGAIAPASAGMVHISRGPLRLCKNGTLHATMNPDKWNGERVWVVALFGETVGDQEKYGALHREIIGEIV